MKRINKLPFFTKMLVAFIAVLFLYFGIATATIYEKATVYLLGKIVLSTSGYLDRLRVGTGSTPGHSTTGTDDAFIEGDIEVDGISYADGGLNLPKDGRLRFGTNASSVMQEYSSGTTLVFATSTDDYMIQWGTTTKAFDFTWYAGTAGQSVTWDASASIWTFDNVRITTNTTLTQTAGNFDTAGNMAIAGSASIDTNLVVGGTATVTGAITPTGGLALADSVKLSMGTHRDFYLYSDGTSLIAANSVDDTDFTIGNTTKAFDVYWYAGTAGQSVEWDASASIWTFDNVRITTNTTITQTAGNTDLAGNIAIAGSASVDTDVNVGDDVMALGKIDGASTVATAASASIDIDAIIGDDITLGGKIDGASSAAFAAAVSVDTDIVVGDDGTFGGKVDAASTIAGAGAASIDTDAVVGDDITNGGKLDAGSTIAGAGAASVDGNATVGGSLTVTGAIAGAVTMVISGAATFNGNLILGNAITDTITIGGSMDGLRFDQRMVQFDAATSTGAWSQTTGEGWTLALGTGNGRDATRNVMNIITDSTVGDVLTINYGATVDITNYNYLGFWIYAADAVGATEFNVDLATAADTVMCSNNLPSITATDWVYVDIDVSACTDKTRFQKLLIVADSGVAAETLDFDDLEFYRVSNGHGPALGRLEYYPVTTGTVTRGELACLPTINTNPLKYGVKTCAALDQQFVGIACSTSATNVLLQTSGSAIMVANDTIADEVEITVASGTAIDDASSSVVNGVGYALEAAADAGEYIWGKLAP